MCVFNNRSSMRIKSWSSAVRLSLGALFHHEICLSGSLPVSNGIFGDRMAGRLMGRIQDGTEARRLLSRLLLGIDGSPVCLWCDEPVMGRQYQRLCPAREDHLREPIGQPPWRSFV